MESTLSSGTVLTLNLEVRLAYLKVLLPYAGLFRVTNLSLSFHLQENPSFSRTSEETLHSDRPMRAFIKPQLSCLLISCVVPSLVGKHGETLQEDVINHKSEERCVSAWFFPVYISTISLNVKLLLIGAKVVLVKFQFEYIRRKGEREFGVKVWWSWCRALIPGAQVNS